MKIGARSSFRTSVYRPKSAERNSGNSSDKKEYCYLVGKLEKALDKMRRNPAGVEYVDLDKVCRAYFGEPRQKGTSHAVFKTP